MKIFGARRLNALIQFGRLVHIDGTKEKQSTRTLKQSIIQKIKALGPITIAEYMKEGLINPVSGYYTTRDVFGKSGDFVTSPEISQMFGELIAVWFVNEWRKLGAPQPYHLLELGPGRGTMTNDILRVFNNLKIDQQLRIHLIEISDVLANIQAENLNVTVEDIEPEARYFKAGRTKNNVPVYWYRSYTDTLVRGFMLTVAHEFFDALPAHKFQKTSNGWREVLIDLDHDDKSMNKLRYVLSRGPTPMCKVLIDENEPRSEFEASADGMAIMELMADRMERYGGVALIIDYGHEGTKTDTFRAFRKHKQCDPLSDIGNLDLTVDVDFMALRKAAGKKLVSLGPVTQRHFLTQMNIDMRLQVLMQKASDEQTESLNSSYHMLVDEDKMGNCFYVVSFFPAVLKSFLKTYPPVGFIESEDKC